jgi:S1-C subfamily serine protease
MDGADESRGFSGRRVRVALVIAAVTLLMGVAAFMGVAAPAAAQGLTVADLVSGVVRIKTFIDPDARTLQNLGREREGSGIVIDDSGLVLTIGYLMVEAYAAEIVTNDGRSVPADIVGYDHASGFGLLKAVQPLKVRPVPFGRSAEVREKDPVIVASHGGPERAGVAVVVAKREFAGSWEYLLEEAIFTSPPHPNWSGAALINREGKLVGVGSLIVGDATGKGEQMPGNMFVPIDLLPAILGDMIASGHASGPERPGLGVTTEEKGGRLVVNRVAPQGPAEAAGMRRGDIITGVGGEAASGLGDLYRKMWARGTAGVSVPLDVERDGGMRRFELKSMNRRDHLKLKGTF